MKKTGFTLIELLVTVAIMMIILGGGIASFLSFNDRQTLITAGKEVQAFLRSAQTKARVGDRPAACDRLLAYRVKAIGAESQLTMTTVCKNGEYQKDSLNLPVTVTVEQGFDLEFQGLHGGVVGSQEVRLTDETNRVYAFVVTTGGEITDGGLVETP